jgi:alkane 1-monooxygenase
MMTAKWPAGPGQDSSAARSSGHESANPLVFFMIYAIVIVAVSIAARGGWYMVVAPLGITFFAVPVLDVLIGADTRNPPEREPSVLAAALFRLATWLALPTQAAILLWGASIAAKGPVSAVEFAGVVLCAGMSGGVIGINVSHELIHRGSRIDRALGGVLLVMVTYRHWAIEHVAGHHRRVATPEDPASARLGEALPAFWARSVVMGFWNAWQIERARCARHGTRSPLMNRVLSGLLESCGLAAGLGAAFGPRAVGFFLAQSAVAIAFLETINYIEHYGLERRLIRPNVYERVTPSHSWNASHWLTNTLLFNLQRHSDHHAWPARPYYRLRHHAESPQLPYGYAAMTVMALIPPLWRRVMDPRVREHRAKLAEASLAP